ncbi:MAG: DNA gyrase subunit A [Chthonomonadaceae bacterium]|uniref:DNA gyrase subunit A n=1 Tax=Candidatus Nitrosymbiomonas proteolyticus TaxID=2608984 RepID=A0A809R848_9BACT|nr:DNA gyrase subunit A [Candidatus Nitrosymbiomonas proteolyticus]HQU18407.1 DNA gyrase subunit A [Fimbriimonadaceae bacterium]
MEEPTPIEVIDVQEELGRSYVNYAMSVIIARALPDVRDGLKPVQRRVLYTMRELNLTPDNAYTKSAKVTGDTSGNYHPHGDDIIYPTLVRMAQPFNMRYPLVDGQGNFGNVDGDPPAAKRYTECRLTAIAMEMLEDLDRETVDWIPNYLQTLNEPTVLPAKFPNLLCNGVSGIAVGMATNMPPHNLTEVCNAILMRIDSPDCTLDDVMEVMPGPDFPTYGIIMGASGIRSAYETGRGSIIMQAKTMIEPSEMGKSKIIVTEIPYQVNKENLKRTIGQLVKDKKFDGILSVQDYSDKRGMRMEIELRRDINPNKALNFLLKHSQLRTTFGAIMLSLVDGAPRVSPLLVLLDEYIDHRREVIERRTRYELYRALEEVHLNEGFQIARRFLDEIIALIRNSDDPAKARAAMVRQFELSPFQANAILNMALRRLTKLEQTKLEEDYKAALLRVHDLMDILSDPIRLTKVMKDEIVALRDKFGDERRTKIVAREARDFSDEDLVPEEDAIISISRDGYIKRVSKDAYRVQKRGGKGVSNVHKTDDEPAHLFQVNTHHYILFFTDRGRVYKLRAFEIPETGRYAKGMPVINYVAIESDERVTATISIKNLKDPGFLIMITRQGEVKRTAISKFANIRSNGLIAFDIEEGDDLCWVLRSRGDDDVIIVTRRGQSIRFSEKGITSRSRAAGGVRAMRLKPKDYIVSADIISDDNTLLVVGENGYGKRTALSEYRVQGRGGSGILTMNVTSKTGEIVSAEVVAPDDRLLIMTTQGKAIRTPVKDIRLVGRVAQGVKLINLAQGDSVRSIARLIRSADEGEFDDIEEPEGADEGSEELEE